MEGGRRYDIDWLRVFATYLLLVFHTGMVFNPAPFYHIRNHDVSLFFLILCGFIGLWHMPLFFLLAGWSAFRSLSLRGTRDFLAERFFRLFVPLVAGCVLLMPAIKYLELSNGLDANVTGLYVSPQLQESFRQVIPSGLPAAPPFAETFLQFLPTFFTDYTRFTWAHLWFIAYLLTFTVLYLPLFRGIQRARAWLKNRASPLWVYAPILPLATIQVTMRERWPGLQNLVDDWANFAYYSTFLLCGFLLARFPVLEAATHRERERALAIACLATLLLLLATLGVFSSTPVVLALTAIAGWCFVVALLGLAHQKVFRSTPALSYLTESALPVYLLHQSAIVIPGYFLIRLPLGLFTKFVLLLGISAVATIAVYHFLVRPFSVPRFLCGMKPKQLRPQPGLAAGLSAASLILVAIWFAAATPSEAARTVTRTPVGLWYAEGGAARVEITECDGALCGRIVWLRAPFDENGCPLRDRFNPDETLRNRPVVGLQILRDLEPVPGREGNWKGGTIYDPGNGNTYRASLAVTGENRLEVRGYIGIPLIGRTARWFRVGAEQQVCGEAG